MTVAIYFYVCFLDAKRLETIQEGRLFLKKEHMTRRRNSEHFTGVLVSIFAGLFTAMLAEFIMQLQS